MITLAPLLVTGLTAGTLHVFTGPDHLAAVAPLAISQRKRSWILGARWGLGHASGVILVAVLAWLFRELLPVELFSARCERLVGVLLIGIGVWGLRKALRIEIPVHDHSHDGHHHHAHTALGVGVLHGLAGGSHFLGVLPALAMPTKEAAALYLLSFGAGTIIAMAGFSLILGWVGEKFEALGAKYIQGVLATCSGCAILVGGYWLAV